VTPQAPHISGYNTYWNQQRIAASASISSAFCFTAANVCGAFAVPYMPLGFSLNTVGTAFLAICLIYLVWTNHGRSRPFLLFTAGALFLFAGRICELPWLEATLESMGLGIRSKPMAGGINTSFIDLGYCSAAWAVALLSISATRNQQEAQVSEWHLRLSEERYRRLVQLTPNWIFETNREGIIELTNSSVESVLGYQATDLQGRDLIHLSDPAQQEFLRSTFRQVLEGHPKTDMEIRFIGKNGECRWISLNLVAVSRSDGTVEGIQGDGRDITLRKETADTLQRRERHLSCLAEIQATLLGHSGMQGLFDKILSRLGRSSGASRVSVFESQNDSDGSPHIRKTAEWCAQGISPGNQYPIGRSFPCLPSLACWVDKFKQNQVVGGIISSFPECERDLLVPDGALSILVFPLVAAGKWFGFLRFDDCLMEKEWGATELSPLRSVAAAISLAVGRANAEEEKIALERKMLESQKLESLGVLAGGIAHDFNNLLTTIMGNANLACDLLPADSPARPHLISIDSATQRAADLAHQMLAYTGRGQLTSTQFDLNETARELMKLLAASLSKKVNLACHLKEDLPLVEGDPTQIRQVIMNLVINAAEAIGEEKGTVTIRSHTETVEEVRISLAPVLLAPRAGSYVTFEVTDTGCGMDPGTLERIFDPFFTTKVTGHGLGLAAVHGIIRSHGGGIHVRSTKGSGTTFVVYLPAIERPNIFTDIPSKAGSGIGSGTILIADDEEDVRDLVESVLLKGGYRVITACDGVQAINIFKSIGGEIDAVILDLSMPNLSGAEALNEIRALSTTVPVILSSGFSEGDVTERFSESHASGFIQKPYRPKALLDIVSEVLPQRTS
jgi:PAS domain S-box-containing protein